MTGYGEASAHEDGVHYFVQIRTLNGKYFKTTVRLQDDFEALEAELESALRHRIARGTASIRATCTDQSDAPGVTINTAVLDRYVEQLQGASSVESGKVSLDAGALLSLPGVLQHGGDEEATLAAARPIFRRLLDEAATRLVSMRESEGKLLEQDLRHLVETIGDQLAEVRERAPRVIEAYQQRLVQRIRQLVAETGAGGDESDVIREVAGHAERTDIAEEISRLSGHTEQFLELLGSAEDKPVGRTLDFLAQEMLREANTMSSKSSDSVMTRAIVEIKGAIDRIKEQVQNVE
ncbi:MAG: YicC/YloC family endoribonuclease [Planctomycetota bacterium]